MQIKQELEENRQLYYKDKKPSLVSRLYATIAMTGVIEKVPGFSESAFFVMVIVLAVCVFGLVSWFKGAAVGGIAAVAFFIVVWYILSLLAYNRRIKLESQLLQFINACSSASMQYSSIIDIFGATYEQFKNPLRDALEECYVEAKQMNDKERAIRHLVEKFDSAQFAFVIDNLELCSSITGDYHGIAKDISETVAIYSNSHEKKKVLLRNAKINIGIMFGMCIVILYVLSLFLGGLKDVLLNTFAGNVGIILLILMLFYSMNMKAEK
jgi:Flp pilus assembly protein TadB